LYSDVAYEETAWQPEIDEKKRNTTG